MSNLMERIVRDNIGRMQKLCEAKETPKNVRRVAVKAAQDLAVLLMMLERGKEG